jgi:hypothetical protein
MSLVWFPVVLQVVVPLALLGWLAFGRHTSHVAWALALVVIALYLLAIRVAGMWLDLPWYLPLLYAALGVPAMLISLRFAGPRSAWPSGRWRVAGALGRGLAALAVGAFAGHALSGRRPPAEPVDLAFPLDGGSYLVVNGGGNALVNAHLKSLTGKRFRAYRGQSHGVDLVELDARGLRAEGIAPRDPEAYVIFGAPVHAPCGGTVVSAADGLDDLRPPATDREHMAGNHVLLECDGIWVLLGHLQRGSVAVRAGQQTRAGQLVGQVGNTGNTDEPHLHVHAQRPGAADAPFSGDPLPISFAGRYPVRNARIR